MLEYHFNDLEPVEFQRLINGILLSRFGESIRITPLRGKDGGRDAETAPLHPQYGFLIESQQTPTIPILPLSGPPRAGRYLFQVKHHRTLEITVAQARDRVVSEFEQEVRKNVLPREGDERVNFFVLATNVTGSPTAIDKLDAIRLRLLRDHGIHSEIWWKEQVTTYLDQLPALCSLFPQMFAGGQAPFIVRTASNAEGLPRAVRLAVAEQFRRDSKVRFRQIDLEQNLSNLFVDLDALTRGLPDEDRERLSKMRLEDTSIREGGSGIFDPPSAHEMGSNLSTGQSLLSVSIEDLFEEQDIPFRTLIREGNPEDCSFVSALPMLLDESLPCCRRIILEGGPGQGKSTITQMAAQIHRSALLNDRPVEKMRRLLNYENAGQFESGKTITPPHVSPRAQMNPEGRWSTPKQTRVVMRIELRAFGKWLLPHDREDGSNSGSVELYWAELLTRDSGGAIIGVEQVHSLAQAAPLLMIFDGLDEVGGDDLRDRVCEKIMECITRLEEELSCDLRVILTTRPPAISGRQDKLSSFRRFTLMPLVQRRIESYLDRWIATNLPERDEKERVREAFTRRREEPHVKALARNPMQLSVLLHFVQFKGEAFPGQRAQLYQQYFGVVIDRDVEKYAQLLEHRDLVEQLHGVLGYFIHALTETGQADRTLTKVQLTSIVGTWLRSHQQDPSIADVLFKLSEERLGLVVATKGEGADTRYGFDIQPVQEYFAAYFINEDNPVDSHALFEAMLQRPYWHEVALFLAGLCHAKEKADLVSRAKLVDAETWNGWRQDGRSMVLRLLQEGIFSRAKHVLIDALDYIIDSFDPRQVPFSPDIIPAGGIPTLSRLFLQGDRKHHVSRLRRLLAELTPTANSSVLRPLLHLISTSCEPTEALDLICAQPIKSSEPMYRPTLRLRWANNWGLDLTQISSTSEFWDGSISAPNEWAECWWATGLKDLRATNWNGPIHLHEYLAQQLAWAPTVVLRNRFLRQRGAFVNPNWAIWQLLLLQEGLFIHTRLYDLGIEGQLNAALKPLVEGQCAISYDGLKQETRSVVQDLVAVLRDVSRATSLPVGSVTPIIAAHLPTLERHIKHEGWRGWIACRVAFSILRVAIFERVERNRNVLYEHRGKVREVILQHPECSALWQQIRPFYVVTQHGEEEATPSAIQQNREIRNESKNNESLEGQGEAEQILRRQVILENRASDSLFYSPENILTPPPEAVVLAQGENPTPLISLWRAWVCEDIELPLEWLKSMPYEVGMLRHLVHRCPDCLPTLLEKIGTVKVEGLDSVSRLHPEPFSSRSVQRVLRIAEGSTNPHVLIGALRMITYARLSSKKSETEEERNSMIELILSMLKVTPGEEGQIILQRAEHENFQAYAHASFDAREVSLLCSVAEKIRDNPRDYPYQVTRTAANVLAARQPLDLTPLNELSFPNV